MRSPPPADQALTFAPPTSDVAAFVALELLAAAPYAAFVYGDLDVAARVDRRLVEAGVGELADPFGVLARDAAGDAVGMFSGPFIDGELAKARLRAALTLRKDPDFADAAVRDRASRARGALLTPDDGDAYLSRIAVAPSARGRGVGRALLAAFLDRCRARGARRAVLEVATEHEVAADLYRSVGFSEIGAAEATDDTGRTLRYRHLGLVLARRSSVSGE